LRRGGALLQIDGKDVSPASQGEYPLLYQHFANLIETRTTDVDLAPLRLTADAFLLGRRVMVEPFEDWAAAGQHFVLCRNNAAIVYAAQPRQAATRLRLR
jgi:hypothetical protein